MTRFTVKSGRGERFLTGEVPVVGEVPVMGDVPVTGDVLAAGLFPATRGLLTPGLPPGEPGDTPGCVAGWVDVVAAGWTRALACRVPCRYAPKEHFREAAEASSCSHTLSSYSVQVTAVARGNHASDLRI